MANDNKLVNLADLKEAFDDVKESIPSKTSQLTNDNGYITEYTETDPTVPSWAKASSKPSYSASEVGAKSTQSAVNSPTASGTALAFIDTISQNAQGVITPTKKTVAGASQSAAGLMSANDKKKLDGIASGATANTGTVTSIATGVGLTGGTITGSGTLKTKLRSETALTIDSAAATTTSGRVYPVAVDKTGYLAVNVPWTSYSNATTSAAGLMSSTDKSKLDGTAIGATNTKVKGNAESSYRTGNVNLTPANIGATRYINLTATTAADIYNALNVLSNSEAAVIHMSANAFKALTGNKGSINYALVTGIVFRVTSNAFNFDICKYNGPQRWAFQTTITSSAITPGTVYTYAGTAVS